MSAAIVSFTVIVGPFFSIAGYKSTGSTVHPLRKYLLDPRERFRFRSQFHAVIVNVVGRNDARAAREREHGHSSAIRPSRLVRREHLETSIIC